MHLIGQKWHGGTLSQTCTAAGSAHPVQLAAWGHVVSALPASSSTLLSTATHLQENKSLNIFNSRLVLASPETATDMDFARIEGVVGHEYFHNWTGNRVTCRDWFQLTLKEGLTVFRDEVSTRGLPAWQQCSPHLPLP